MLKMKRTLAILLALCFLMSVTAAAVSADAVTPIGPGSNSTTHGDHNQKPADDHRDFKRFDDHRDKRFDDHRDFKRFDDHRDFKKNVVIVKEFNHRDFDRHHKFNRGHWVPGHFEKKVVKTIIYKHHEKIVIKKIFKVWVPGHWVQFHHFR